MAESEQQEKMLSETVVKEAIGLGMKSPLRDSILEAVEEADGTGSDGGRSLPLAGILFGAGAALGFLAGQRSPQLEETSIDDLEEPDIIEDVMEEQVGGESASVSETTSDDGTSDEGASDEGGSSRVAPLLLLVGVLGAIAVLRRRFASSEEEEWEPIEEFEPATSDELEDEEEELEAEAETDEGEESEETEEE
ncbi:hypothetical protein [Haloterrigena alkaliphila]|uniref:MYXO-CTERM domain-containing protein n=1 Tax=Haloterrigena alkaliphila TaxID=2816475 RepID=A0A8A2VFB3_9EURY|nr:hypothetical protein [Haloterrigena alkaliphila]QSW99094.1 hypothetical protein J0X25_17200 [Haloterrigena alkaliphila]